MAARCGLAVGCCVMVERAEDHVLLGYEASHASVCFTTMLERFGLDKCLACLLPILEGSATSSFPRCRNFLIFVTMIL